MSLLPKWIVFISYAFVIYFFHKNLPIFKWIFCHSLKNVIFLMYFQMNCWSILCHLKCQENRLKTYLKRKIHSKFSTKMKLMQFVKNSYFYMNFLWNRCKKVSTLKEKSISIKHRNISSILYHLIIVFKTSSQYTYSRVIWL